MAGLEGISVGETRISWVNGEKGELVVRGLQLEQLEHLTWAQMAELLWERPLVGLGAARLEAHQALLPWLADGARLAPMNWLRLALECRSQQGPEEVLATLTMALILRRNPLASPDPQSEHFEDVVRMLGYSELPHFAQALRRYWICVAEHGMNASTFTARVVASTRASYQASVGAALGALEGPLHGGAPGPVLDMLDELKHCQDPENWLLNELSQGRRLMGFGHRVYRQRDPRADFLQKACSGLPGLLGELDFAAKIERLVAEVLARHRPSRPLRTNVEYYTALLLSHLGFKRDEFTAVFACGRVLGWMAHIFEQQAENKLIRPEVTYVGALAAKG